MSPAGPHAPRSSASDRRSPSRSLWPPSPRRARSRATSRAGSSKAGDTVLETSNEIVEEFAEDVPGGGVVNQVWDVALVPGRLGIRVATTALRRGRPAD